MKMKLVGLLLLAAFPAHAQSLPCLPRSTGFFSAHLDPVMQAQLEQSLGRAPASENRRPASAGTVLPGVTRQILSSHREILRAKKREADRILELARTGQLRWVGIELPDADVQAVNGQEAEQIKLFIGGLTAEGISSTEAADLALLNYDSVQYAISKEPALFKNVRRIGLEDPNFHAGSLAAAEKNTSGEILPVIVHHSQNYRSAKRIFWLAVLLVTAPFLMEIPHLYGGLLFAVVIFLYLCDAMKPAWLSRQPFLLKLLDPRDVTEAVERAAALKFETLRVQHTAKRTGVMIFISFHERRALVLGDQAISAKLQEDEWNEILAHMLEKIGAGQMAVGLEGAIREVGEKLRKHFPAEAHDRNEIANELVISDEL